MVAIYITLPVNGTVRLSHLRSGDGHCRERFLAFSADKHTCNYDPECSNHHPFLSTLRSKRLSYSSKMKWWAIYINLPVNGIVRLPHPYSGYIFWYIFFAFTFSSDKKDFTFVKFTTRLFSSVDESLKNTTCLLLLWDGLLVTLRTFCCVRLHNICGEVSAYLYCEEQSFWKLFHGWALFPSLCAFWLCSDIHIISSKVINMESIEKTELCNYIFKNRNWTATNVLFKVL